MKILSVCLVVASLPLFDGCAAMSKKHTYTAPAEVPDAIKVTTDFGDKIRGNWILVLDDSISTAKRSNLKPDGLVCSGHDFVFDASEAIAISARKMAAQLFDTVTETKEMPTFQATSSNGFVGATVVKLDDFSPRFTCGPAGAKVEGWCSASAVISLTVTLVQSKTGLARRSFSVSSQRWSEGPEGNLCSGALTVLSHATSRAAKDVFEEAAQRVVTMAK